MSSSVLRFAPSPNGWLHMGHALSALFGFRLARRLHARFHVRIEDIDVARSRPEYIAGVFEDLAWLGIEWAQPVMQQSKRFDVYRAAAHRLLAMGLLYPCFATRAEIAAATGPDSPRDPDGALLYPGLHKHLSSAEIERRKQQGEPFALRIDMARAARLARTKQGGELSFRETSLDGSTRHIAVEPECWGDAVIFRKDVPASYHLAVVVDDAEQRVDLVTRGMDLYAATSIHRVLQLLLDLPEPVYLHHRLLVDPTGRKLSKSDADTSLRELRTAGTTASDCICALEALAPELLELR